MADNLIIGTAGHVDHGKTTLIKALTGENTDRLQEEQERGVSIDLGFSSLELEEDLQVGIIDVPGHEKFIKNMLAGSGGVDLGLLVVAADEAIMPQTREHLAILELLDVKQGLIAVTKEDAVEDEWLDLVIDEIKEEFQDTFLAGAEVIPVSGIEGTGIDKLKEELARIVKQVPEQNKSGNVYFPIDRVFSVSGYGTIVTGTLLEGTINVGDELEIYPSQLLARVRGLQVHGAEVETVYPGQRIGINLAGIDKDEIDRGAVVATPNSLVNTGYLDARLKLLESAPMILEHGARIRLHLGAKEVLGRVYLLDQAELCPGEEGLVQFRLEETVVADFKERFVLRRHSPMTTIGGGEILETNPSQHGRGEEETIEALNIKEQGTERERISLALRQDITEPLSKKDLVAKTNLAQEIITDRLKSLVADEQVVELDSGQESTWIHNQHYQDLKKEILSQLEEYHQDYHLRWGMPKEELRTKLSFNLDPQEYDLLLDSLKQEEEIIEDSAKISLMEFDVVLSDFERRVKEEILLQFEEQQFRPPKLTAIIADYSETERVEEVINLLITSGELVKVTEGIYFSQQALEKAEELLIDYLTKNNSIDLGQFRDLLASSRKYTLPLLEYFDQIGLTVRRGEKRVLSI
jgi:selenocysteine-specific elongation factor